MDVMTEIEAALYDLMQRVIKIESSLGLPHVTYIPPAYAENAIPDRKTAKPKKK